MSQISTIFQNNILHKSMPPLDVKSHIFPDFINVTRKKHYSTGTTVHCGTSYDLVMRIILLGDQGAGKTSFLKALRVHPDVKKVKYQSGVGIAMDYLEVELITSSGKVALIRLCDTGGQERYRSLTSSYYRGAHGALLIFDLTHQKSLDNVDTWLSDLDRYTAAASCTRLLLGSNCTANDRTVQSHTVRRYADNRSLPYMEFDSTQFYNVVESLQFIVDSVAKEVAKSPASPCTIRPASVSLDKKHSGEIKKFACDC